MKKAMDNWIAVENEVPEDGSMVIVFAEQRNAPSGFVKTAVWDAEDGWFQVGDKVVTYWMPLPAPPRRRR